MTDRYGKKAAAKISRISGGDPTANRGRDDAMGVHGRRAETKVAKRLGARLTSGSGNKLDKGDMVLADFRIESKATKNRSMSLKLHWLEKIHEQAVAKAQQPALALQFVDDAGEPCHAGAWVAIPEHLFNELLEQSDLSKKE